VATPASRLTSVDALRGAVMVLMALDHVRDFFHTGAMSFSPEDLTRTTPTLFFTRWITHFCAPAFLFLAGVGAYLRLQPAGTTKAQLSRFLWTRGLWLVFLELTLMRLAMTFELSLPALLLILWALGISMVALAALVHLPSRALAVASGVVIVLHNVLDPLQGSAFGAFAGLWNLLHQPGLVMVAGVPLAVVGYPFVPWVAVMAAGYCSGALFLRAPAERRRVLLRSGTAMVLAFLLLRALNLYGDPVPWSGQASAALTACSFLRVTKYPPSLSFLLMTLGPALLALAWLERRGLPASHPLVVIGRVPLFYYVVHFWAIHLLASLMAWLRYGNASLAFVVRPLPSMGGPRELFPADFGYSLGTVYLVWAFIVALLFPLCRWFATVKARRSDWWLSYL
jgi:uncharacterized membrane protein